MGECDTLGDEGGCTDEHRPVRLGQDDRSTGVRIDSARICGDGCHRSSQMRPRSWPRGEDEAVVSGGNCVAKVRQILQGDELGRIEFLCWRGGEEMSPTFIGMMFVAILLLAYWRLTLLVLAAALLAAVAIGLGLVPNDVAASAERSSPSVERSFVPTDPIPPALRAEPPR